MKYPNNIKKEIKKNINYSNRGMDLEYLINIANDYYLENDIAVIYKKPTPIGIVSTSGSKINNAYFKEASTLDYNGLYKGKYVEFDAKVTKNTTSFPLNNIHKHQLEHMNKIINHKGITFIILEMNNNFYLVSGKLLINYINTFTRKSIPYDYIVENCINLKYNYLKGIDYIIGINKLMEDF